MSRWFRMYDEILDDPKVQKLPAEDFKAKFLARLAGEQNEFSEHLDGPFTRPFANEWASLRASVFSRDGYTCTYCGARGVALECDHVVPVAKGGDHNQSNLTTACRPCNRSKRDKLVSEWNV